MSTESILTDFELNGWNTDSQLLLLCNFIDQESENDQDIMNRLQTFLESQSEIENENDDELFEEDEEW